MGDLVGKMQVFLHGTGYQAFSVKHMKRRLNDYFGDRIFITQLNGKPDVVTFRDNASTILFEFYKRTKM